MTTTINITTKDALRGNYVLLTADTLHLLLPQREVGAAEYLKGALEASGDPGLLKLAGADDPRRFAALSAQMTLLPDCPPERFLVTPLGEEEGNGELGWCWNELQILIDVELQPRPLPEALLAPGTPVEQYVELEGTLAYLCSAQKLRAFAIASTIE